MRVTWEKGIIPKAWSRSAGVLIPKETESTEIRQFHPICQLNIEGQIIAQSMAPWLEKNKLLDTSVQKAGNSGFSNCLEHTNMIWHQIQTAKKEGTNLHADFLDLANAFDQSHILSIGHLWTFFRYRKPSQTLASPFSKICSSVTTAWQRLEVGRMEVRTTDEI